MNAGSKKQSFWFDRALPILAICPEERSVESRFSLCHYTHMDQECSELIHVDDDTLQTLTDQWFMRLMEDEISREDVMDEFEALLGGIEKIQQFWKEIRRKIAQGEITCR